MTTTAPQLTFRLIGPGLWRAEEVPKLEVRRLGRTKTSRNGYRLPGWAVVYDGREVRDVVREPTKRYAVAAAQGWYAVRMRATPTPAPAPESAPPAGPLAPYIEAVNRAVADLTARAQPPARIAPEAFDAALAEADLADLIDLDNRLSDRLIRRVQYDTLKAVLVELDGWVAGAEASHDGLGRRRESPGEECWAQYAPDDIRRMVNAAARTIGTRKPWSAPDAD